MKVVYSIVVPVYNEEHSIPLFYNKLRQIMDKINEPYEIIFVNDGSKDKTINVIKSLAKANKNVKLLSFSRNFGKLSAISCGLEYAEGDAIVCLDADLQDPIEIIPKMIAKWKEGFKLVHGKRVSNKIGWMKRLLYRIYLWFVKQNTGIKVDENYGSFKLLDRKIVEKIKNLPQKDFFVRSTIAFEGANQTCVEYQREKRCADKSKYSLFKVFDFVWRGILSVSTLPLSLAAIAGVAFSLISTAGFTTFIILAMNKIYLPLAAWLFPAITCCFAFLFSIMGFNNIYIKKIYEETQKSPQYVLTDTLNIEK